jgi:hypothetical protein
MMKLLLVSIYFGIFFFWMSVLVDAFPTATYPQRDSDSTTVTLFLLGSGLSALAFLGKRTKIDE